MPFTDDFNDIYHLGIKQSCEDAGAYCERVDEQYYHESMLDRIYNQISKADFIVADMTNKNPNVFYEVGYAHALGKKTILLTQNVNDIPFDLKHYPHIIYSDRILKLKEDLTQRLKWFVENSDSEAITQNVDIDLFLNGKSLNSKEVVYTTKMNTIPGIKITLFNSSFKMLKQGDFRVGVITDDNYTRIRNEYNSIEGTKTIKLPDGKNLHMCKIIEERLYPNSYTNLLIILDSNAKFNAYGEIISTYSKKQEIIIRVFTATGFRDFFMTVDFK